MMWKESGVNKYPEIVLSDCSITNIEKKGDDIVVDFGENGFAIKDIQKSAYYRTTPSQVVIKGCDIDNIEIKEIRTQQLSEELFFESAYDVESEYFIKKINKGKWKFEVVYEFYSCVGALYIGHVNSKKKKQKSFWCCVMLQFKELLYLWNEIRYDHPY